MSKILIIFSGGQDSTTCLAIAKQQFSEVHLLTFNYGQRHQIELDSAKKIGEIMNVDSHEFIDINGILKSTSPLISENPVQSYSSTEELPSGVAETFVPSRNALFLTIASNRAIALGIDTVITGVSQTDYSGYPDCRSDFIDMMERTLSYANFGRVGKFFIQAPLMHLTKAETVKLAVDCLGDHFEEVFENTHTCYNGVKGGCGECAACLLRDKGFKESGIDDPIWKFRRAIA